MAGKINIRRVESVLPTVCLLIFLALCVGVAWLSSIGLPEGALRYVERKVAEQGIYLSLEKVRLDPMRGVAVRTDDVRFYTDADKRQELGRVQSAAAGLSLAGLMSGELRPSFLQVLGGDLGIPVTEPAGESLSVRLERMEIRGERNGMMHVVDGKLSVQGMAISLAGSVDPAVLPKGKGEGKGKDKGNEKGNGAKLDLAAALKSNQDIINRVYNEVHNQMWKSDEYPTLDLRLDIREDLQVVLRMTVPRYDAGQFHFRDATADLLYNKRSIIINSLSVRTTEPDAVASLQGSYDLDDRHLIFNMSSTVALMRMIRHVSHPRIRFFLEKFRHPDANPPSIELSGDVEFEEDYTLQSARVRGRLTQENMMVGSTKVDELELSFFYDNGDFNIDKLALRFPDGSLQALASAKDREGQAQLVADLPIQKVLTLVNELSSSPVELPEGLRSGERVNLLLHAHLDAPSFKPGQDTWQDFVPTFHMLGARLSTDKVTWNGYHLEKPCLEVKLAEIQQKEDYLPEEVERVQLTLEAAEAELPTGDAKQPVHVASPHINADIRALSFGDDGLPNEAASVTLSTMAESVTHETAGAASATQGTAPAAETDTQRNRESFSVRTPQLELIAKQVRVNSRGAPETSSVREAQVKLKLGDMQVRNVRVGSGELALDELRQIRLPGGSGRLVSSGRAQAIFDGLKYGNRDVGKVTLNAELGEYASGCVVLQVDGVEEGETCMVSAKPNWSDPQQLLLEDVQLNMPAKCFEMLLDIADVRVDEIEAPELVRLSGNMRLTPEMQVQDAALHVEIPKLVRTPQRVRAFRGKRIPVGLEADVTLRKAPGAEELNYAVQLGAAHETGRFTGRITGSTAGDLRVTGHNTIRPDVVDQLIDNTRAHSIIRDFRFNKNSKATISDIVVQVDCSSGVQVDSFCRVELLNAEYQMGVLLDNENGTERVRTDIGQDPYTLVNRATCGVTSHVRLDCKTSDGEPIPDEVVVTITDPTLFYNNAPWLRRNKWKSGARETKLSGEAVIIDVEHSFVELRKVSGTVYPAYSLGMFYPELYGFLEDIVLPNPALVQTELSLFPIYDDCKRPMSGTIRVEARNGAGFRFIGTTIPLENFSGFISLADKYVLLDRMNAKSWEGVLDAAVRIGFAGKNTDFDGVVKAKCMNLQKIAASYGSKLSPALCSGEIRFRSPNTELRSITAYGRVDIEDGDLLQLSLFRPVSEMISDLPEHLKHVEKKARGDNVSDGSPGFFMRVFSSVFRGLGRWVGRTGGRITNTASSIPGMNHLIAYDLKEAHADFQIANGYIFTNNMKAIGSNLNVQLNVGINLDTLALRGNLWPKISSLPTILLAPVTALSDFMMDIVLYGTVSDVKWRITWDKLIGKRSHRTKEKEHAAE